MWCRNYSSELLLQTLTFYFCTFPILQLGFQVFHTVLTFKICSHKKPSGQNKHTRCIFMWEIIQSFSSAHPCRWHSYDVMQRLFLRIGLSKHCNITQQRYTQLFTKPRLIHLPAPRCPPFISQDDSVKLSVITLGSDRLAGASATTHHPIPLLATSVSCGPPCARLKIKTLRKPMLWIPAYSRFLISAHYQRVCFGINKNNIHNMTQIHRIKGADKVTDEFLWSSRRCQEILQVFRTLAGT